MNPDEKAKLEQRISALEATIKRLLSTDRIYIEKPLHGGPRGIRIGISSKDKLAFFNITNPITQWSSGTGRQDVTSNTGLAMNVGAQFNGNTGSTYYSVGDIVAALKSYGLLA